ncbi:MAG: hypothetical protein A2901_05440 [Elusimicrobia bacterium RIFCSPLOWO2_01_FULL_54_10]|nr:MAG: hypothetical protein A2901_05440 [Elusimicrobia bacterium RIFCSPLOWO2_01_FULL_54_10]
MAIFIRLIVNTAAVMVSAYLLKGVHVDSWTTALVVSIVLGVLNAFLKPILIFFTLPITILTLGLFVLVINAALVLLAARLVPGFEVAGFIWALLFGFVLSIINTFLHALT